MCKSLGGRVVVRLRAHGLGKVGHLRFTWKLAKLWLLLVRFITIENTMTDDWEEPSSSTTGGFGGGFGRGGGGFGRGSSSGFGSRGGSMTTETGHWGEVPVDDAPVENRLRGFGRGRTLRANDNTSGSGSGFGSGGGFGRGKLNNDSSSGDGIKKSGFGGGGFGKSNDDENNNKGGFKKGGFGSSNGSGGFGSTNDDEPRGGGFGGGFKSGGGGGFGGGRSGGGGDGERKSGACYKCQEEGHMARDCPSAGGGGGRSNACFKCQEEGHMARDCPSAGGGGGRSNACFKCNEEGHMARDCPSAGGGGGGRSGGRGCHKCGEEGHFARECPSSEGGGGGGGGGKGCYKCGEQGHFARECPNEDGGAKSGGFGGKSSGGFGGKSSGGFGSSGGGGDDEGGDKKSGCFKCGEDGHFARECPNPEKAGADGEKREIYIPPPPPEDEAEIFKSMQMGINFNKYDDIPVHCTGNDAPKKGVDRFDQVDLYETFQGNVTKAKYDKPTPVQKWAIPIIMSGRDLMACAQTGSGKTAAFLLPVLTGMMKNGLEGSSFSEVQEPQALIIGPTRELVVQIHQEARKFAHGTMLRPVVVYGGTSVGHQLRQVEQGTHLLVGTPGRLVDFIQRGKISLAKLKYLILDEADRMLDMGFVPEIRKIVDTMQMPPKTERQTLMFSATFPEAIQQLAGEFLENYLFVTVGKVGGANTDIEQTIHNVSHYDKRDKLVSLLNDAGSDRVLVFVEQKRNADFLASFLSQSDFPTTSIHGDRLQREREEALRDFKLGKAPVLVATSVAARGLDIPDVKHVINYDMPSDIDEYVHRIGRTGRCGNLGKASSFFNPESDGQLARPLVKVLQEAQQEVPDWLEEAAQNSFGSGGFTGMGGKFGSKDTRRGQFGGDDAGTSNGFGGGGGGGGGAAEEEVWD